MKKIILGLVMISSISAFADENPNLEERVARLEKLVGEPVLLSSCFMLPAFNNAFVIRHTSYFNQLKQREGSYTYGYQQVRKLLINEKTIQQVDNLISEEFHSLSEKADDNAVDADLKQQVANFQKDKAQFACP